MVGVPGRSKGCITCRKRKKGCDLKQPECGQCKERGTKCEGYDTDRIFVNQSAGPISRSANLSRRPRKPDTEISVSVHPQAGGSTMQMVPAGSAKGDRSPNLHLPASVILPASLFRTAFSEKSLEAFVNMYIPQGDYRNAMAESKDLVGSIPKLSVHDGALRLAILAIGTVSLGKRTSDLTLIREGRKLYSKALLATRRALQDPIRARSTAVLAIPRVMSLYEILYGAEIETGSQAKSWLSHAEGETALIIARGPEAYNVDDAAHSLFADARYRSLIASVRTRKASVLNRPEWKTLPWKGRVKTPNDSLLDIMAGIPEILENVHKDGELSSGLQQDEARDVQTSAKCWNLHFQLRDWLTANEHKIHTPITVDATPISFPNLEIGNSTIRYWVICLMLYASLDTASGVPTSNSALTYSDRPHPRQFARLIARSVWFFFQKQYGITGATAISFPLGNALLYMKRNPQFDAQYLHMIKQSFNDPSLPRAIGEFLFSMTKSVTLPNGELLEMSRLTIPQDPVLPSEANRPQTFPGTPPSQVRFLIWILLQHRLKI